VKSSWRLMGRSHDQRIQDKKVVASPCRCRVRSFLGASLSRGLRSVAGTGRRSLPEAGLNRMNPQKTVFRSGVTVLTCVPCLLLLICVCDGRAYVVVLSFGKPVILLTMLNC